MYCKTVNECFQEINAYCTGKPWGHPLLVNLENFNDFQTVLQRLEADTSKQCIFVSQFTQKNGLPIIDDAIAKITGKEIYVMVGASQAAMLRNETAVDALVDELLGLSISGHAIILLNHCKKFIDRYLQRDPRYDRRVVLVEGSTSPLPQIKLTDNEDVCVEFKPLNGIQGLLKYMEKMDDAKLQAHPALTVLTGFKTSLFRQSLYSVTESTGIYDAVCQKYSDLLLTKNEYGTQEQWAWLLNAMNDHLIELEHKLLTSLQIAGLDFIRNGSCDRIPGNMSLSFRGSEGEMLLHRLDLMGISVSTGSACDSKNTQLSHVLKAIHTPSEYANGTIRISLGYENTDEEISYIAASLIKILQR